MTVGGGEAGPYSVHVDVSRGHKVLLEERGLAGCGDGAVSAGSWGPEL